MAQRPEVAPLQGAKVTNRISGESEPLMRRADESLSVSHEYDQQRRTFRAAVCEERAGAADGDRATRRAVGVLHLNGQLRENKGESVSGAEWRRAHASRSAAETNSLDRYPVNRT